VKVQAQVEDLVASASESDALSALQDFIGDHAPSLGDALMDLREQFEVLRAQRGQKGLDPGAVNRLRNAILELAYVAADQTLLQYSDVKSVDVSTPAASRPSAAAVPGSGAPPGFDLTASATVGSTLVDSAMSAPPKKRRQKRSAASDSGVVCRLDGVSRTFGKGRFTLDPVTLDIRRGEIIAIAGRNASGKTTLLRMMMGELLPTSGRVSYPGLAGGGESRRPNWSRIKRQIAAMPQLPDKWHGRLRHNLNYVAAAYGQRDQDLRKFIDWHLARYELLRFRNSTWDEISGGYKIRFELVRALLSQPKLLVLDEPLAYLDVVARERFLRDIRAIADSAENPMPIVITSQHLSEIEAVADHIVLLDDGVLKYSGKIEDISGGRRFRVLEVALDAMQTAVETALAGARLQGIEPTVEGYILAFPKEDPTSQIFARLAAAFGDRFTMMRDITGSVRAIMSDVGA
jgi:ABC-type multidrug transport system ATPase subunit